MGNNEFGIALLGVISAVFMPVLCILLLGMQYIKGRNQERVAMIEKGIIPEEIEKPEKKANRYPALRNGLLLIGIALGAIIGVLLGPVMTVSYWLDLTILTMTVLFAGIAFIIYFFLSRKMEEKEREADEKRALN